MAKKTYPSIDSLRDVLEYRDGELYWRKTLSNRGLAGSVAGSRKHKYTQVRVFGVLMNAHRVIWAIVHGEWPPHDVDHINMDSHDNRIENLRLATRTQNKYNTTKQRDNTSGFKGVDFSQDKGKWRARISVAGKVRWLGYFHDAEMAGLAYAEAAERFHGEFARSM